MDNMFERAKNIYSRYTDDEIKKEYEIYEKIMDIDGVTDTLFIEYLDDIFPPLSESIIDRFMKSSPNVVYLK